MTSPAPESSVLARLRRWCADQCDGTWEHGGGVSIDTLDNPGWRVRIDTGSTAAPLVDFDWRKAEPDGDADWLCHRVENGAFPAAGDPSKLDAMLRLLLALAGR